MGTPFYVMDRVDGIILRGLKHQAVDLTPEFMKTACLTLVATLAEIHDIDVESVGLSGLGRPEGYVSRQVHGWLKRYLKAKTDDIASIQFVGQWLIDNMPPETSAAVIHNDYKYDNLVLSPTDPSTAVAVLDWEMCTVGCPLMDLGTSLAYWVDPDDPAPMQCPLVRPHYRVT